MTLPPSLVSAAEETLNAARTHGLTLAVAESCTGGLISAALTAVPGSSDVVDRGFVTYTDRAKMEMLGVPGDTLKAHGAVSEETARAMAEGVLGHAPADLSASVTGIAGPGGGSDGKPVGLVHFAAMRRGGVIVHERHIFTGDRDGVRLQAALTALGLLKTLAV